MPRRAIVLTTPTDLRLTLAPLRTGRWDPTIRFAAGEVWRATRTPHGPATVRLTAEGRRVAVESWGPGAEWALETAPDLVGCGDDPEGFRPASPLLRRLARHLAGLRLARTRRVVEALVPTILGQKVTAVEQHRAWRRIVRGFGEPAPGPGGLVVPPDPAVLARLPYFRFHPLGVERRRAETIRGACRRAERLEETVRLDPVAGAARLRCLPGIGPWTTAIVARVAWGDPDAVEVGDYHLPHIVAYNLDGRERGDDALMLDLLEPYRGHRGRVVALLRAGGRRPPRYGPRLAPRRLERL